MQQYFCNQSYVCIMHYLITRYHIVIFIILQRLFVKVSYIYLSGMHIWKEIEYLVKPNNKTDYFLNIRCLFCYTITVLLFFLLQQKQ